MDSDFLPVIGLEIHIELSTESKMFCGCSAKWFGKSPNTNVCPVCLGLPGALPVPNATAIESAIQLGLALGCHVHTISKFDRKHYFYPDLPKGYQISQYDQPFSHNGVYKLVRKDGTDINIGITRVHIEEDTGKLSHEDDVTLIDFNRSGVPLVEIVTEPDFSNSDDMKQFLEELQVLVRYLGIAEADMEKGSMRLEPNISVKKPGQKNLPAYKVEVKNINSFRFAKNAVDYEIKRHILLLKKGEVPIQETRGFIDAKGITASQRTKEEAHDYRYFPEPDIPPFIFKEEYIQLLKKKLPELPNEKVQRYIKDYSITYSDAYTLTRNAKTSDYFEKVIALLGKKSTDEKAYRKVSSSIVNKRIPQTISPEKFVHQVLSSIESISTDVYETEIIIKEVLHEQDEAVDSYKKGKTSVIMFLVGCVMKRMNGKADPRVIRNMLEKILTQ